jgi:hypothetical protein
LTAPESPPISVQAIALGEAFTDGPRARGLLASGGEAPLHLDLVIRKADADTIVGRTARIDPTISVLDRAGHVVYQDSAVDRSISAFTAIAGVGAEACSASLRNS